MTLSTRVFDESIRPIDFQIRRVQYVRMALTETPSSWLLAAQAGGGPSVYSEFRAGPSVEAGVRPILSALGTIKVDTEGTTRVGAIKPMARQWRADVGTSTTDSRQNRWSVLR